MLHKTRGIALHATKFSETSSVVKIYTELFGLQSYIVKGVRKKNAKIKPGLFQPLTILDLVVYHKVKSSLQNLKEANYSHPYQAIPFDIRKSSIALFINELFYKTIHEEEPHPELFLFLYNTCLNLDAAGDNFSLFHLVFSLQLTRYLGCMPQLNYSGKTPFLNLREGIFQTNAPEHRDFLEPTMSKLFFQLLRTPEGANAPIQLSAKTRDSLLEIILFYYHLHVPGFREIQSHHILHKVLG
ncbi:MAG: DNA repair protein RecO [Bacteroidales bacterium]|jgi:DNA repair protein RecO (recombination protein O)